MKEELPVLRATYDHKLRKLQERIVTAAHNPAPSKRNPHAAAERPPRIPSAILRRLMKIISDRI